MGNHLLAHIATGLGFKEWIRVGNGVTADQTNILSDTFEAVVGAIFLDGGQEAARRFVSQQVLNYVETIVNQPHKSLTNFKGKLQEIFQQKGVEVPIYKVLTTEGPDHKKVFQIGCFFQDNLIGTGTANTKREAEQIAAEAAFTDLTESSQLTSQF